ncbi:MAG: hypothetical protein Q9227_002669 [Pyrenula ochraceoflavens]
MIHRPLEILEPFLKRHVSAEGYIGVWVTNRENVQKAAQESMARCGFELHEEWLWLKVTAEGEPVSAIEGLWRQPYEVFMLFRKPSHRHLTDESCQISNNSMVNVPRRVIIAVPDMHSRKPCLKEILEERLLPPGRRRVLEVYARNMTAGWWSWGDEVLKFNWEGHWIKRDESSQLQTLQG